MVVVIRLGSDRKPRLCWGAIRRCSVMYTLLRAAGGGTRQGLCFLSISSVLPPFSVDPRLSLPWITSSLSSFRMKFRPHACPIWLQFCCLALSRLALCLDLGPLFPKYTLTFPTRPELSASFLWTYLCPGHLLQLV